MPVTKSPTGPGRPSLAAPAAVQAAVNYFAALNRNLLNQPKNVSLEEIEMSPDRKHWLVTLGYDQEPRKNPRLPEFLHVPIRKLKVFKVDARSGEVLSMKRRNEE